MSHCIGIDVGGTTSTVAIGDQSRDVVYVSDQFASSTAAGPQATIDSIFNQVYKGLETIGGDANRIIGVGLASPGPASMDGILYNSPNFRSPLWNEFPFRAALEEKIRERSPGTCVHYVGDGQAAALGEYAIRTGSIRWNRVADTNPTQALSSLFMVIVGTGLGGGEVRGGHPVRGNQGRAGHAGHIFLPHYAFRYEHDQKLLVGNAKCTVESAVSLTGLTHQLQYRLSLDQWRDHALHAESGTIRDKAKQLRELAAQGDALAQELFDDQARALGIGLLSVNYIGDYDLLVIGGGVCDLAMDLRERYLKTVQQAYHEFALDGFRNLVRIEFSACGDESPVIGSLAYAYDNA